MSIAVRHRDDAAAVVAGLGLLMFFTVSFWLALALSLAAAAILAVRRGQAKTWRTTLARTLVVIGLVVPVLFLMYYALTV